MRAGRVCAAVQVAMLLVGGCASTTSPRAPAGGPVRSGYLTDYGSLRPSPDEPGRWYALSARVAGYDAYIVDMPVLLTDRTTRGVMIDPQTGADLCQALHEELTSALSGRYRIAGTPGPGVARIRTAISQVAGSAPGPGGAPQIGGATREMEIVDSQTGARLAAVVETDFERDEHAQGSEAPYHDTRAAFAHWSARLMLMLRDAGRLATAE